MKQPYRLTANLEWTSKCNARCSMCPRHVIEDSTIMSMDTWRTVIGRLNPADLYRAIIAGYGEPTTHPQFEDFIDEIRDHPVHFDMVTNGSRLDRERLLHMDGALGMLMVSFSSIDPDVYGKVHAKLKQQQVMENICRAKELFQKTQLSISLTPMPECIDTLPATIEWFHQQGIYDLRMSPNFYNRAGTIEEQKATRSLRAIIRDYRLKALDIDFIPGLGDMFSQWRKNSFKCIPRNTSMFVTASGDYLYCYNDMSHTHTLGNARDFSMREAIVLREQRQAEKALCDGCNMRDRYRGLDVLQAAAGYLRGRMIATG